MTKYVEYQEAQEVGAVRRADDLDELATMTKLPVQALAATIEASQAMQAGKSKDPLGRDFTLSPALAGPPWYGIRGCGALFHTQGGLVIDGDAAVQRADGTPLPNLFAGGGSARSVSGPGDWGYIPAAGLFTAVTQGRLAGTAAARLVEAHAADAAE